jgi:hypothetical protein
LRKERTISNYSQQRIEHGTDLICRRDDDKTTTTNGADTAANGGAEEARGDIDLFDGAKAQLRAAIFAADRSAGKTTRAPVDHGETVNRIPVIDFIKY